MRPTTRAAAAPLACLCLILTAQRAPATDDGWPSFDLRDPAQAAAWGVERNDLGRVEITAEGLRIEPAGDDPYLVGPPCDWPGGPSILRARLYSERGGGGISFMAGRRGSSPTAGSPSPCRPGAGSRSSWRCRR